MLATGGIAQAAQPRLWQPYNDARHEILQASASLAQLKQRFPDRTDAIDRAVALTGVPAESLRTLPLLSRQKAATVLVDAQSAQPVGFIELDSF